MQHQARIKLFTALAIAFSAFSLVCLYMAVMLVDFGANPPPGESSLGHVGIVVLGLGSGFLSIVLGLLALWAGLKARDAKKLDHE